MKAEQGSPRDAERRLEASDAADSAPDAESADAPRSTDGVEAVPVEAVSVEAVSGAESAASEATPPRRRRIVVLVAVAAFVYALDVVSKVIVVATLSNRGPVHLIGGILMFQLDRNPGAAFSIGVNMTIVFTVVAVIVAGVIIRTARRLYSAPWAVALGMLLGGALGNLTDRVFRAPSAFRGQVVDFIEVPHYPIFNFADSGIVIGGCLMVLLTFRGAQLDGSVHRER